MRILGIILIALGAAALAAGMLGYKGFSFEREKPLLENSNLPLNVTVKEKQTIPVPPWAGAAALAAGVVLVIAARK